ncbi:Cof-type HAD-IIB family hydrolase [Mycoplasmopsis primatum]|uniref:Cof-type HAD-IIB family hydrolase n=1 Tax=Mycoplasmopsis primatum TaxID=55604 RepID=UPI00049804BB|nr:Cof-type HAD-IIB family hydrolase [Mycoplasmopsis primatum]
MTNQTNNEKQKFLFAIDLDGTLLSSSMEGTIPDVCVEAIQRARDEGHIVCIFTGRPWRSTKPVYDKLGLDTAVANYNGAQIHNPKDDNFIPYIKYLNLNEMLYILGDPKVQNEISNLAIEGPGWVQLQHRDADIEAIFGFNTAEKFTVGINLNKVPLSPTGIVFDVKETTDVEELRRYLRARYGDLGEFSYWSKGEGLTPVFDITNVTVNKGRALSLLSRYYGVDLDHTVAFGDGFNDVSMFQVATTSVVVGNASDPVRKHATIRLKKTNKQGAVGEYLNKFLDDPEKEINKSKKMAQKMRKFKDEEEE